MSSENTIFSEGKAVMHYLPGQEVFYNPVQEFNRDLSILVIRNFFQLNKNALIVGKKKQLKQSQYLESKQQAKSAKNAVQIELDRLIAGHVSRIVKPASTAGSDDSKIAVDDDSKIAGNDESKIAGNEQSGDSCSKIGGPLHRQLCRKPDEFVILEALSATGLRSIRYALEIDEAYKIIANDMQHQAVCSIVYNSTKNNVLDRIIPCEMDAVELLHLAKLPGHDRVEVIDLDPYGSPSLFLDPALQAINEGGLLCITCTDVAGLCGNCPEAAFGKYGAFPTKCRCCHEMALRLALSSVETAANRFKRYIVPLLSLSVDFYLRMFVQVFTSANEVRKSCMKKAFFLNCDNCHSFAMHPIGKKLPNKDKYLANNCPPSELSTCPQCESQMKIAGPIWSDPIHDATFVSRLLQDISKKGSTINKFGLNEETNTNKSRLADSNTKTVRVDTVNNNTLGLEDASTLGKCGIKGEDSYYCDQKTTQITELKTKKRIIGMLNMALEELPDSPLFYSISDLFSVIKCTTAPINKVMSAIKSLGYRVSLTHAKSNSIKTDAPSTIVWDVVKHWALHHTPDYSPECCEQNPHAKTILAKPIKVQPDFTVDSNVIPNSKRKKLCRFQTNPAPYWGPMSRDTIGVLGTSAKPKPKGAESGKQKDASFL